MAQHDMNIANQGFPAFRSDLNDALAALVSNSSGATAPSTTFAHQLWVDTAADPSVLKIRNADNDAFITIGTINQTGDTFTLTSLVAATGGSINNTTVGATTAAAGSFTTLNTSGAVVFNDAGADVDFRVEGDTDANLLFVDASADKVGIGTSSPTARLHSIATSGTTTTLGRFEAAIGSYTGTSLIAANTLSPDSAYNLFSCISDSDGDGGGPFTEFSVRGDGLVFMDSGYGSAAAAYGCRAWVNFDGTVLV
jgi:hypothetical protein